MTLVHRNAQPFYLAGNKNVICLLIHGFTGSPADMGVLGTYLNEKEYGVSSILLPGHGTSPEDLMSTAWPDWYRAVDDEYLRLQKKYKDVKVIPIGLSMGGMLALHLAANYSLPGAVCLSAPVYLADARVYDAANYDIDFVSKNKSPAELQRDIDEGRFSYNVTPMNALASLLQLIETVKGELPCIFAPVLIIQSKDDKTVKPESADYIYEHLGTEAKELIWLKKSGHVITLGMERRHVFSAVEEFLQKIC